MFQSCELWVYQHLILSLWNELKQILTHFETIFHPLPQSLEHQKCENIRVGELHLHSTCCNLWGEKSFAKRTRKALAAYSCRASFSCLFREDRAAYTCCEAFLIICGDEKALSLSYTPLSGCRSNLTLVARVQHKMPEWETEMMSPPVCSNSGLFSAWILGRRRNENTLQGSLFCFQCGAGIELKILLEQMVRRVNWALLQIQFDN